MSPDLISSTPPNVVFSTQHAKMTRSDGRIDFVSSEFRGALCIFITTQYKVRIFDELYKGVDV